MADVIALVEETVRSERGRIMGSLLRLCGNLDDAEEAFQEAALAAVQTWPTEPPP